MPREEMSQGESSGAGGHFGRMAPVHGMVLVVRWIDANHVDESVGHVLKSTDARR